MGETDRLARLRAITLSALVRANFDVGESTSEAVGLSAGAAMSCGSRAFFMVDERHDRALGAALAWAVRHGATSLDIVSESATGTLARRAQAFDFEVRVWTLADRSLLPAVPQPLGIEAPPLDEHLALAPTIAAAGADVVVEHGAVVGEVRGLEVCRAVTDPFTGAHRLEVGVGAHDREAFALIHGDTPTVDSLRRIVDTVRHHRRPGADPHPLNRLAGERALRARVIDEPSSIGLVSLTTASPAEPRPNLKDPIPCVAVGSDASGRRVIAVFSTGIDLDLVPFAADARLFHGGSADELVLVMPARDDSPATRRTADLLRHRARIVGL